MFFLDRTIINEILNNIDFKKNYPNVRILIFIDKFYDTLRKLIYYEFLLVCRYDTFSMANDI